MVAIADDYADVDPDLYTISHGQFQYVDSSTPLFENTQNIVSAPRIGKANILEGVFDNMSYLLICLSMILVGVVLSFITKMKVLDCILAIVKATLKQDLEAKFEYVSYGVKLFLALELLALSCVGMMYNSIVISIISGNIALQYLLVNELQCACVCFLKIVQCIAMLI